MHPMPLPPDGRRRIVVLGAGGDHRTEAAIARAGSALGLETRVVDVAGLKRRLGPIGVALAARRAAAFEPDVVLCTRHAHHLGARLDALIANRFAAVWYFDAVARTEVTAMARRVGRLFTTYQAQVPDYLAAGVERVHFLPQGVDPDLDRPTDQVRADYRCDVSFVGSGPYPHRWPLLEAIGAMCQLQIRGPGWKGAPPTLPVAGGPVRGTRFAEVVGGARISLGASAVPAQDTDRASASNRMWKILGCGGLYLGPRVPGIEAFARDGEHCRWYEGIPEAVAITREVLADPERARALAHAGRAHALAHHTYAHRLARLLADEGWAA